MKVVRTLATALILAAVCGTHPGAQGGARRLATIDALRQYPGYYHLQNVLVHGEFGENGKRIMLRANETEITAQLASGVSTSSGTVEVRGQLVDVGRLEPGDPRAATEGEARQADRDHWPRPGEELVLQVSGIVASQPATSPSVRAIALEPWRFAGRTVTVTGNFRGRNLFGDLPDAPGKGRYDFIVRGGEGSIWVTGLRPRGSGFDLDVDRRVDSNRWVEVTGPLTFDRGLVRIDATKITLAKPPEQQNAAPEESGAIAPLTPGEVVFNSPTEGETDVSPASPVRVQFSKGLTEASLAMHVRTSYVGAAPDAASPAFKITYDAANRAIEMKFAQPLEPFRTVKVELLDGVTAFDGAPVKPWTVTFSVGN